MTSLGKESLVFTLTRGDYKVAAQQLLQHPLARAVVPVAMAIQQKPSVKPDS
jgi:hypothetical protein